MNLINIISLYIRKRKLGKLKAGIALSKSRQPYSAPLDPSLKHEILDFLSDPKQMAGLDIDDCYSGNLQGPLSFFSIIVNDYDIYEKVCGLGADTHIIWNNISVPELILSHASDDRFFEEFKTIVRSGDPEQLWTKPPVVIISSRICLEEHRKKENQHHIIDQVYEIFDFLIEMNIDPDDTLHNERSILMAAMDLHDRRLVEYLLKNGADITREYYIEKLDKKPNALEYLELRKDEIPNEEYRFFSDLLNA